MYFKFKILFLYNKFILYHLNQKDIKAVLVMFLLFHPHIEKKKSLSTYFFKYTFEQIFYSIFILFKYIYFILLSYLNIIFFIHFLSSFYFFVVEREKIIILMWIDNKNSIQNMQRLESLKRGCQSNKIMFGLFTYGEERKIKCLLEILAQDCELVLFDFAIGIN